MFRLKFIRLRFPFKLNFRTQKIIGEGKYVKLIVKSRHKREKKWNSKKRLRQKRGTMERKQTSQH